MISVAENNCDQTLMYTLIAETQQGIFRDLYPPCPLASANKFAKIIIDQGVPVSLDNGSINWIAPNQIIDVTVEPIRNE